jgi:phage FluMu protein Com
MAKWVLRCKDCDRFFTHSEIGNTLADYFLPETPKLPPDGLEMECPHCKVKAAYLPSELRYKER